MMNLFLPLLLTACGPAGLGGQSGSELESACTWVPSELVSVESAGEPTHADGFEYSFEALSEPYIGEWSGPLTFESADDETLTLTIELGQSPRAYTSEDTGCVPYYEVDATVTVVSDSALDEVAQTSMRFQDDSWALLQIDVQESAINGDIERQGDTLSLAVGGRDTLFGDLYWSIGDTQYDAVGSVELTKNAP